MREVSEIRLIRHTEKPRLSVAKARVLTRQAIAVEKRKRPRTCLVPNSRMGRVVLTQSLHISLTRLF